MSRQKTYEVAGLSPQSVIYALHIKDTGELIGHVIYHPFSGEDRYEIGWVIAKEWWVKALQKRLHGHSFIKPCGTD